MAVSITSVTCPACGAALPIQEGRTQVYCSYCGTKVIVQNENEHIYRHVDEAKILQAETDRMIRLKELALEEKSRSNQKIGIIIWLSISAILLIVSILMMTLSSGMGSIVGLYVLCFAVAVAIGGGKLIFKTLPERAAEKTLLNNGGIRFPKGFEPFSDAHYDTVLSALQSSGFTNIRCVNLHDITFGLFQKPGKIASITVAGKEVSSGGNVYLPDTSITITYHGK